MDWVLDHTELVPESNYCIRFFVLIAKKPIQATVFKVINLDDVVIVVVIVVLTVDLIPK